jgi:Uma2 family endonuclease
MNGSTARKTVGYTWTNYRSWDDGQRWELIGGEAHAMSPAPSLRHQRIQSVFAAQLEAFFRGKKCQVFPAPTDVKLSEFDVVQPDIAVVCERERFQTTHIDGPPTLIVEILSPSTATYDRVRKLPLYAASGVREVWVITPYPWLAEVFVLDGGSYRLERAYGKDGVLQSRVFRSLKIRLADVFNYPIDPGERVEMVKEGRPPYGKRHRSLKPLAKRGGR